MPKPKIEIVLYLYFLYICIMFIRRKYSPNTSKIAIQICESKRIEGKVQQKVIRNVGYALTEAEVPRMMLLAEHIKFNMENTESPTLFSSDYLIDMITEARKKSLEAIEVKNVHEAALVNIKHLREESRVIAGIHDVYGKVYEDIGFNKVFGKRRQASMRKLFHTVMTRISDPLSKRASVEKMSSEYGINISLQGVYEMMDGIEDSVIETIKDIASSTARKLIKEKVDVLFYDCTTLYFESFVEDGFKELGYSKDHKFNQGQVVLSLIVSKEGLPIGYEVYPGSQYEGNTVIEAVEAIQKRYEIERVVMVADSGMINTKNMKELDNRGIRYILGARLKNMSDKVKQEILSIERNEHLNVTNKEIQLTPDRRLIVSYKPDRAKKDRYDREKWTEKLQKKIEKSKNPKNIMSNFGYKAVIKVSEGSTISIDEDKLKNLELWDGLHGIITNDKDITIEEAQRQYSLLWQIEACFRVSKHDLKIRPIYHWTERRIRAHIAICFMALVCVRYFTYTVSTQIPNISAEEIRKELKRVQVSVVKDIKSNKKYCIPSHTTPFVKRLYHIVGKKSSDIPYELK